MPRWQGSPDRIQMNTTATGLSLLCEKCRQNDPDQWGGAAPTFRQVIACVASAHKRQAQSLLLMGDSRMRSRMDPTSHNAFSANVHEDAYIELVTAEVEATLLQRVGMRRQGT